MESILVPYAATLTGWIALGALYLMQALVADLAGIRAGHVPGTPIIGGHADVLFRATRAQANTNENLGIFVLLSLAAMLLGANPWWTNTLVLVFVVARAAHMLAYYADLRTLRSAVFAIGLLCLFGLLAVAAAAIG